jgi:hypothetical protein
MAEAIGDSPRRHLIERILGIDIPTPPGNVQPLRCRAVLNLDKKLRKLSSREHVAAHSNVNDVARSAACQIDPLSFVWEQYDLFGRPRRRQVWQLGRGQHQRPTADKTPFSDIDDLRRKLIEPSAEAGPTPRFTDAFRRRLYAYVLGRSLDHGDEAR